MNRLIIFIVCIALGVGGLVYWRMNTVDAQEAAFRTAPVEHGTLVATVSVTGTLQPEEVVDVGAQVAGRIVEFGVDKNGKTIDYKSQVEKGMILARIDEAIYRADLDQARGNLEQAEGQYFQALALVKQAKANVERAEADLGQMEVKLNQYKREWDRVERLSMRPGAISDTEKDVARANYDTARATLGVGNATVSQTKAAIEDARANVLRASGAHDAARAALRKAETSLSYCSIRSPVEGTIVDRRVNVGQTVVASLSAPSIFLIAKDLKKMQIWAAINEADVERVRKGQTVRFTTDGRPGEVFQGEVFQVRLNAQMTQNVVTYTAVVTFDNSKIQLLPYQTANVTVEIARQPDVDMVPNAALRWQPEREQVHPDHQDEHMKLTRGRGRPRAGSTEKDLREGFIWVEVSKGLARPIKVKTGLTDGSMTEIEAEKLDAESRVIIGVETSKSGGDDSSPFAPRMMSNRRPQ